jgi:hypothetical protein
VAADHGCTPLISIGAGDKILSITVIRHRRNKSGDESKAKEKNKLRKYEKVLLLRKNGKPVCKYCRPPEKLGGGGEGGQEGDKAPGVFVMKPERYCQGNGREQKEKRRQKMLRPGQYAENYVGPATRNI